MNRLRRQLLAALRSHLSGGRGRPPEGGTIIWNIFSQLSRQRTWHPHGPNPISYSDLESYCRLARQPLEPRHVSIVMEMDRTWLDHILASLKSPATAPARPVSRAPMTAALFDALFG